MGRHSFNRFYVIDMLRKYGSLKYGFKRVCDESKYFEGRDDLLFEVSSWNESLLRYSFLFTYWKTLVTP